MRKHRFYRTAGFWIGIALWAICAWWFFSPPSRMSVEYGFSRAWYRWVLDLTIPLTQSIRFPVALVLLVAGYILFLLLWIRAWIRFRRMGTTAAHWRIFGWGIRRLLVIIPALMVWFIVFWGAGYRRLPVEERLHLDASAISAGEAGILQEALLREVRSNLPRNFRETGPAVRSIQSAMERLVLEWDGKAITLPSRVKPMPKGWLMFNGTSGMCAPFTLEALVDGGLPDTAFVSSAAHELGHLAGFCAEDEASFVGYLSGLQSGDSFARYACALHAYVDLIRRLEGEELRNALEALPEPARQDLKRIEEAYLRYHIDWLGRISWQAYNRYLQAQGIQEGVQSYSHGITLLAYAFRQQKLRFR